jgi:head-tail adaptor
MADELAGRLVERVAIEAWIEQRDAAGFDAGHWQPWGDAAAAVVPDNGGGAPEGAARRSRRRWRVTLRAPVDVDLTTRLIWRGRTLAVLAVETDPRRPDRITLRCEARE